MRRLMTNRRARHIIAVAEMMRDIADDYPGLELNGEQMYLLGFLHDIGYAFTDVRNRHGIIGGQVLETAGYGYAQEVANHGMPETSLPGSIGNAQRLLNLADMMTDSRGRHIDINERLSNIAQRYGFDSLEFSNANDIARESIQFIMDYDIDISRYAD